MSVKSPEAKARAREKSRIYANKRYAIPEFRLAVLAKLQAQRDDPARKAEAAQKIAKRVEARKAYLEENKEAIAEKQRIYAKQYYDARKDDPEFKKKNCERARLNTLSGKYKEANKIWKKNWADNNRHKTRAWGKIWRQKNPDKCRGHKRMSEQKRRARKRNQLGDITSRRIQELLTIQKGKCVACKGVFGRSGFHIDHIIPLSKGGAHDNKNIQLLCADCNMKKHNTDMSLFMHKMGYLL